MQLTAGARPATHAGTRARQTPGGDRDDRPGPVQRCGVVVRDPHGPAPRRCIAGDGDVAAQADKHPAFDRGRGRPRRPIGGQRFRGRAEIQLDARGNANRTTIRIQLDASPAGDRMKARPEASPVTKQHLRERAVIAGARRLAPTVGSTSPLVRSATARAISIARKSSGPTSTRSPESLFSSLSSESGRKRLQASSNAFSSASRMRRASGSAAGSAAAMTAVVPRAQNSSDAITIHPRRRRVAPRSARGPGPAATRTRATRARPGRRHGYLRDGCAGRGPLGGGRRRGLAARCGATHVRGERARSRDRSREQQTGRTPDPPLGGVARAHEAAVVRRRFVHGYREQPRMRRR